jgi:putative FmdB family regulatory protein
MPIYEFECTKCHHEFDCYLKLDESYEELACPRCGKKSPKKLISAIRTNNWSTFLDKMDKIVSPDKFK